MSIQPSSSHAHLDPAELAPFIQHTKITSIATRAEMISHAEEVLEYGFNAAMVGGPWVATVAEVLRGTDALVASAIDFPTVGVVTTEGKVAEARSLVKNGAQQLDVGVQLGYLRSGMYDEFRDDLRQIVEASGVPIKPLLELPLLTPEERNIAVELAIEAGVAYIKNASGGHIETATPASVEYLVERSRGRVPVKASGGISNYTQAVALLDAGAVLLGTSSGIAIVTATAGETDGY